MADFFISYNQADREWAEWTAWALESEGYSTVLQAWDFRPGTNFILEMHNATQMADKTIAIISPDYLSSAYTPSEWAAAFSKDPSAKEGKLIPIMVKECKLEGLLSQIVYINFVGLDDNESRKALLNGISRSRAKPAVAPRFPSFEKHTSVFSKPQERFCMLHIADTQFGFTNDSLLHRELISSISFDSHHLASHGGIDAIALTGDLVFSGNLSEYSEAEAALNELAQSFAIDTMNSLYIVPGNHDYNWHKNAPITNAIYSSIKTEEDVARILSHAPSMELLSSGLDDFYLSTARMLGRARTWRRSRPWRVDRRNIHGKTLGILQLNTVWLYPNDQSGGNILGEYQVREALTELGDCDYRIWLMHHPLSCLALDEQAKIGNILSAIDGFDIVLHSHRHFINSDDNFVKQNTGFIEIASGPLFPSLQEPVCASLSIDSQRSIADIQHYAFDRNSMLWTNLADKNRDPQSTYKIEISLDYVAPRTSITIAVPSLKLQTSIESPQITTVISDDVSVKEKVMVKISTKQNAMRKFSDIKKSEIQMHLKNTILLVTAVQVELEAVLRHIKPLGKKRNISRIYIGQETYYIGRLGEQCVVATMCGIGSLGRDSVILATHQAINEFTPKAIIMVGIAFGRDRVKQNMGDVLVASQVVSYEQQRVGEEKTVHRGTIAQCGAILLNRFRQALDWHYENERESNIKCFIGPLLSGEKLIDNENYKKELFDAFPQAIGGEMEGAGLYAVAARANTEWIVVKSICDWADGKKEDTAQTLAADTSVSLVKHVLSNAAAFKAF